MAGVGDTPRDYPAFVRNVMRRITALERRLSREALAPQTPPVPAGTGADFYGAVAPDGWLLCDGSVVLRSALPALFAAIGTTYNTGGEAGTQFRLPGTDGRVTVGKSTDLAFFSLGQKGGQGRVTLTEDEMPSHTHPPGDPATSYWGGAPEPTLSGITFTNPVGYPTSAFATGSAGGGQSHDNLQPYIVVNRIIKT